MIRAHRPSLAVCLVLSLATVGGCNRASAEQERPGATALASSASAATPPGAPQASAAPAEPARSSYSEQTFDIAISGPQQARLGEPVEVKISLTAKDGFKVNAEYPIKFRFEETAAVVPALPVLRQEQGKIETHSAELRGSVKLTEAGARAVRGKFSFGVCRADVCIPESRELIWTIDAS